MKASAPPGARASKSVMPSPTITTVLKLCCGTGGVCCGAQAGLAWQRPGALAEEHCWKRSRQLLVALQNKFVPAGLRHLQPMARPPAEVAPLPPLRGLATEAGPAGLA